MALMTYLTRDHLGTYYFRRAIPADLRPFMPSPWTGKANWKLSLRTKDGKKAKRSASQLMGRCIADFDLAAIRKTGDESLGGRFEVDTVEQEIFARLLDEDEAVREDGDARKQLQTAEERQALAGLTPISCGQKGMEEDFACAYGQELAMLAEDFRKAFARRDPSIVHAECLLFLKAKGVRIDQSSDEYRQLGLAVLRAHVRAYEALLARQRGEIVPEVKLPSANKGPTITKAFDDWKAASVARGGRKISARTLQEAAHAVRRLKEWCGDLPVSDLTREKVREFRDALARMPRKLPEKMRQLPMRSLLSQRPSDSPSVHAATVNKSLSILRAIISHCEASGKLDALPSFRNPFASGVKLAVDRHTLDSRQPFSTRHLASIFNTSVFSKSHRPQGGGGEAAFWLPLIALLSGARLGELVQLRMDDLTCDPETNVWYFDVGTSGGRTVKTASSKRKVPVHPALISIGLLRYRDWLKKHGAEGTSSLWPALAHTSGTQPGAAWSKYFNRMLRHEGGLVDASLVFHSFRHTFKKAARDAGLSEEMHDALTGHSNSSVGRAYGRGFGLLALDKALTSMKAPSAVAFLKWNPPGNI